MSQTAGLRPVDVYAEVDIETSAGLVRLSGSGRHITVSLASWQQLLRFGKAYLRPNSAIPPLRFLPRLLARGGVTVAIHLGAHAVARCGAGINSQLVPRLFGLRHLSVRYAGLAAACAAASRRLIRR